MPCAADAAAAGNPAPKGVSGGASIVNDLTHNDMNQIDFGDFQMLVITLLAVVVYLLLLTSTWFVFNAVPAGFVPVQDKQYLVSFAQLPDGATLDRT